jgi:hypothetical protein
MTALDPIAADAESAGGSQSDGIGMMSAARPLRSSGITAPHADPFKTDGVNGARCRHRDVPQWSPLCATMRGAVHHAPYHDRS